MISLINQFQNTYFEIYIYIERERERNPNLEQLDLHFFY